MFYILTMGFRNFYRKYQDVIELTKAYVGIIIIFLISIYFKWIPSALEGMFNSQTEVIIESCMSGLNVGLCP